LDVGGWTSAFGRLLVGRAHRLPRSWVSWWSERSALGKDDSGGEAVIVLTSRGGAPDPPQKVFRFERCGFFLIARHGYPSFGGSDGRGSPRPTSCAALPRCCRVHVGP